jgi:uncharacterized OsmC-like protein
LPSIGGKLGCRSRPVEPVSKESEGANLLTDQALIDETLKESFPASDPPSWTLGPRRAAIPETDLRDVDKESKGHDMSEGKVTTQSSTKASAAEQPTEVIVEGSAASFAQQVTVGKHRLLSDEPTAAGGTDSGPAPYDLLLMALGSCTSMTVGLYARRKQLPLEAIRVRLRHLKIHAEDCQDCETKEGRLDRIERDVELVGNLDDDQRARLLDIANKCPVHRTLQGEIEIATRLV